MKRNSQIPPKLKIAILGTRGIPANYGGFETFTEELSTRLVKAGHSVTVYCRANNIKTKARIYRGVKLIVLPTVTHKYLDTVTHTFLSTLYSLFTDIQILYYCNAVNALFLALPRIFGKKVIINVDGLEWQRKKWNRLAKFIYKISEYLAVVLSNKIVTDSTIIRDYYKSKFKKNTEYISYGADINRSMPPGDTLGKIGIRPREYILYVSRLEPENNAHILIKAYEQVKTDMPLVIVGSAPYNTVYIKKIKSTKDKRIKFVGGIYGDGYFELLSNAFIYIHGNEVGGTNPALLQAMASGNCVIANGVNFNKEVIKDCGLCYEPGNTEDLKNKIEYLLGHPSEVRNYRNMAINRIKNNYNWDNVVNRTERLMESLL